MEYLYSISNMLASNLTRQIDVTREVSIMDQPAHSPTVGDQDHAEFRFFDNRQKYLQCAISYIDLQHRQRNVRISLCVYIGLLVCYYMYLLCNINKLIITQYKILMYDVRSSYLRARCARHDARL